MNQDVELNMYQKIIEYAKISHNEFSLHCIKVNAKYEKGYNIKNVSAIDSLLCVDYDYCINNGYEVIYTFPLSDDVRDVECRTTVT